MNETKQAENRLVRNVLFAYFVNGAASQSMGSFIPFLRDAYGLSYDLSGMLLSLLSVGNLTATLLAGILPAYLGRRRSVLTTAVWMALAYIIFASGLGSPLVLAAAFLMTGISRGGNTGFVNTMIGTLPGEKSVRGYNLLHGSLAVGALVSPLLLVACVSAQPAFGWRLMAGGLGLLVICQLAVYARMPLPAEPAAKGMKQVDYGFLRSKTFYLSSAMLFFYISTEYAITGWMVTYFQDIGVLAPNVAQMMNSLLWLVIFLGRMAGAVITGRISRETLLTIDGIGFFAFFLLLFFGRSAALVIPGVIGAGFFMSTIYTSAVSMGSTCVRGNDFGTSAMLFIGSVGGSITPALVGFAAEQAGIRAGMGLIVVSAAALLTSILVSVLSVRKR